jgi:hypothetical protein
MSSAQNPAGLPVESTAPLGNRNEPGPGPSNIVAVLVCVNGPPGTADPLPVLLEVANVQFGPPVVELQPGPTGPKAPKLVVPETTFCPGIRSSPASVGVTNNAHSINASAVVTPHRGELALTGYIKSPFAFHLSSGAANSHDGSCASAFVDRHRPYKDPVKPIRPSRRQRRPTCGGSVQRPAV